MVHTSKREQRITQGRIGAQKIHAKGHYNTNWSLGQRIMSKHGTCQGQCYQTCGLGARLGYFWPPQCGQQSLTATLLLLGYFWLPGREMSWNRAPLWKIVNFLSIQGDFEPFQRQWADLLSIDRIKMSYGAIGGDYPQLPELDNLSFFCPIGWFLVNLPHKNAQN